MSQIHWAKQVSADFGVAADWSSGTVPGAGDDAILDAPASTAYTVAVSKAQSVASIQTAATATLSIVGASFTDANGSGSGTNAGTILIGNGGTFALAGTMAGSGRITLASTGGAALVKIAAGGAAFTGGGAVTMSDNPNSEIVGTVSGSTGHWKVSTLANADTITGAGYVGFYTQLSNSGAIDATGAHALIIETGYSAAPGTNVVANSGLLEATNPINLATTGGLLLQGVTITNAATGVIEANGAHTHVDLKSATIMAGMLKTAGGGVIQTLDKASLLNGTAHTLFNEAAILVGDNTALTIQGAIVNFGTISLAGGADTTQLIIGVGAALGGGGAVNLGDSPTNIVIAGTQVGPQGQTPSLTNVDDTISGAGRIGGNSGGATPGLAIVNEAKGVFDATGADALYLYTAGQTVSNAGLFEATGKGGLVIQQTTIAGSGAGELLAANGAVVALQGVTLQGGILQTSGAGFAGGAPTGGIQVQGSTASVFDGTASTIDNRGVVDVLVGTTLTLEGTIDNAGTIALFGNQSTAAQLLIGPQSATLNGGGAIIVAGQISPLAGATLTNVDNSISGVGFIAARLVNEAAGTLNATGSLFIGSGLPVANAGLLEATGNGLLRIENNLVQEATGVLRAGSGATVLLDRSNVSGGTVETLSNGILTSNFAITIDTGATAVINQGSILSGPGGLTIKGTVDNSGLLKADEQKLTIDGAVTGAGTATVTGSTLTFGSSFSQNVTFTANTAGELVLAQSQGYGGTISGFSTTGQSKLDLLDIAFVGQAEATYSGNASGGVLTVTDGTHTAHIKLVGNYLASVFISASDGQGGTVIHDPAAPRFVAAMAGFGARAAGEVHGVSRLREPTLAILAPPRGVAIA